MRTFASFSHKVSRREKEHEALAYQAACEGIVLLKNDAALPISPCRIALFGAGAEHTIKGGTGSGQVHERRFISIKEGLLQAGFSLGSEAWLRDYDRQYRQGREDHRQKMAQQIRRLRGLDFDALLQMSFRPPYGRKIEKEDLDLARTDTCFYVIARQAGEGGDRKLADHDYHLSPVERRNLEVCAAHFAKTIVVVNVGAPFDLSFCQDLAGIDALIFFGQPGSQGGRALADLVTGSVAFSGKLADTFPKRYEDIPLASSYSYLSDDPANADYREGLFVGYRYFDAFEASPLFPFGHGLSYTSFSQRLVHAKRCKTKLILRVQVQNTGTVHAGKDVVQLYAGLPPGKLTKERKKLAAFAKTRSLAPQESQELTLTVDWSLLASYEESAAAFVLEKGDYLFRIGTSSQDTLPVLVCHLPQSVVVSQHQNLLRPTSPLETIDPPLPPQASLPAAIERLALDPDDFEPLVHAYPPPALPGDEAVRDWLGRLSLDQKVRLVVGAGFLSTLGGKNDLTVPGAVGYTTRSLSKRGLASIALADGPSGLRLQKTAALKRSGRIKLLEAPFEFFDALPSPIRRLLLGRAGKAPLIHQFATAFPVPLVQAQTFNEALVQRIGRAVGVEMAEYGVTFWLAPGVNLHRNPLCGRNFEYYSEDPLLAGKLAAAAARGCQSVEGCFATAKHFCANNQEERRMHVSSNVSERVLRELYLRPFEIAVREGKVRGLMTSYNQLNQVYTAERKDLCTDILRCEWGFDGVVMSDWHATGQGKADPAVCLAAGNDLIMPGSRADRRRIQKALRQGALSPWQLDLCVARILPFILAGPLAPKHGSSPSGGGKD